ncbi:PadR family transcriptional regulator [Leucobacter insecticola]|uniref:PadR family transcriptional regulator n=1 Tax=Leucobacter insecticola TaxID=2714934 RepID=A0A6G8FHA6_9MICO|nr:PadR family transcriptional regulator [Leucobacter insecticola]QIM15737.1 PadR family transcriptional regulator [Leucobacter insecticola]
MNSPNPKLTPLGIMLLALLYEGDMHPYEMLRLLEYRHRDRLVSVTKGSVYHTVSRLEEQQLIAEACVDREGNRPERTSYTLREAGRDAVPAWVRQELPRIDCPASFNVALAEAHNLTLAETVELLTQRKDALANALRIQVSELADAHDEGTPEQYLLNFEREAKLLHADLDWIIETLAHISTPGFPWGQGITPSPAKYNLHRKAAQQ